MNKEKDPLSLSDEFQKLKFDQELSVAIKKLGLLNIDKNWLVCAYTVLNSSAYDCQHHHKLNDKNNEFHASEDEKIIGSSKYKSIEQRQKTEGTKLSSGSKRKSNNNETDYGLSSKSNSSTSSCSKQARISSDSPSTSVHVSIDELASYFETFVNIGSKKSVRNGRNDVSLI